MNGYEIKNVIGMFIDGETYRNGRAEILKTKENRLIVNRFKMELSRISKVVDDFEYEEIENALLMYGGLVENCGILLGFNFKQQHGFDVSGLNATEIIFNNSVFNRKYKKLLRLESNIKTSEDKAQTMLVLKDKLTAESYLVFEEYYKDYITLSLEIGVTLGAGLFDYLHNFLYTDVEVYLI